MAQNSDPRRFDAGVATAWAAVTFAVRAVFILTFLMTLSFVPSAIAAAAAADHVDLSTDIRSDASERTDQRAARSAAPAAMAKDIKVNSEQWHALAPAQKAQIAQILRDAGTLKPGDRIVADPATAKVPISNSENLACFAACDAAEAAAISACSGIGAAAQICVGAARAGGDDCRRGC